MTEPTVVWAVLQHDTQGKPRGFEKGPGRYHLGESEAQEICNDLSMPGIRYYPVECVILDAQLYREMLDNFKAQIETLQKVGKELRELRELQALLAGAPQN